MTGGDTKEKKNGAHGAMVQITHRRGSVDTPHLLCVVEDGSNPGGDRDAPNNPNPLFGRERARERGREKQREREGRAQWERNREVQQERKSRGEQERKGARE